MNEIDGATRVRLLPALAGLRYLGNGETEPRNMTMQKFAIIGAVSAVMLASSAHAASITYTSSSTPAVVDIVNAGLDFEDVALALPQWDASTFAAGSILTQVELNWVATLTGSADVTKGPNAGTIFEASVSAFISGTGPSTLALTLQPSDDIISSPTAFGANETKNYVLDADATEYESFIISDTEFAAFIGTGNVNYLFDGQDFSSSAQTGGATIEPLAFASIDVEVTYTYTTPPSDVPLPAALPLLGGGLALMGFVARRRRG